MNADIEVRIKAFEEKERKASLARRKEREKMKAEFDKVRDVYINETLKYMNAI